MKILTTFVFLGLVWAPFLGAQTFTFTQNCITNGSSCVSTLQSPPTQKKAYKILTAIVSSTTSVEVTVERSNGLATNSVSKATCLDCPADTLSEAEPHSSSNIGAGTRIAVLHIGAGAPYEINLSPLYFQPSTGRQSFTVRTSNSTGKVSVVISWQENTP